MVSELALFGGPPTRTAPFTVEPMLDQEEEDRVLAALRGKNLSRYIGANTPGLSKALRAPSAELVEQDEPWSFFGGPDVRAFAAEFAAAMDAPYAISVNSATTGLSVGLAAAGVSPGDEVIMPAISYSATSSAALMIGAIPVFVDVLPDTFCIDPEAVAQAITPRTRAILPVHLIGNIANMDALLALAAEHNLVIIEDAAQVIGATWNGRCAGTIGDCGVFSLQQSKNITTGEGGVIVTRSPEIARRARLIINHGEVAFDETATDDDLFNTIGFNFRMPELCAAMGRAQIRKLTRVNEWRTKNAEILRHGFQSVRGLDVPPKQDDQSSAVTVPHLFVALYNSAALHGIPRSVFVAALRAEGVPVGTGYTRTLYASPHFMRRMALGRDNFPWRMGLQNSEVQYRQGQCPIAESLLEETFLWFYHIAHPSTDADMADIIKAVSKVSDQAENLRDILDADLGDLAAKSQGRIL